MSDNCLIASKKEIKDLKDFKDKSKEKNNSFGFNPIYNHSSNPNPNQIEQNIENKFNYFYDRYFHLNHKLSAIKSEYDIEEQLCNHIKGWIPEISDENWNSLRQLNEDYFFNEAYVRDVLFKEKAMSVIPFELVFYVIEQLEKKMFQSCRKDPKMPVFDSNKSMNPSLDDKGFVERLIKDVINTKLNILYLETKGYAYLVEDSITLYLFIIYLVLLRYPFYILRRKRLENIFNLLKKFKRYHIKFNVIYSWPYPIGSIGMDIFKLLINDLYIPGVTLFQRLRDTYMFEIIDPKVDQIAVEDFNSVILIDNDDYISIPTKENSALNDHFTFARINEYLAYAMYASDENKGEDLENILFFFEKRRKQKEKQTNKIDISEKNTLNCYIEQIDRGLKSSFEDFSKVIIEMNNKLIQKAKEQHENSELKPSDRLEIRKYLFPIIKLKKFKSEDPKQIPSIIEYEYIQETEHIYDETKKYYNDEEEEEEDDVEKREKIQFQEYRMMFNHLMINKPKAQIDDLLLDYLNNFFKIKEKYCSHIKDKFVKKTFKIDNQNTYNAIITFNRNRHAKFKLLHSKYNQKYILFEKDLSFFITRLDLWKRQINPLFLEMSSQQIKFKEDFKEMNKQDIHNEIKKFKTLFNQKLDFNYEIFLIPRKDRDNTLSKYIARKDYIYKVAIYELFSQIDFKSEQKTDNLNELIHNQLMLYVTEAKKKFRLKVFRAKYKPAMASNEIVCFVYGSIHILVDDSSLSIKFEDLGKELNEIKATLDIDIINIQNPQEGRKHEKYLVNHTQDSFLVIVYDEKYLRKEEIEALTQEKKLTHDYFKDFVVGMLDFDATSLNYSSKKISIKGEKLKIKGSSFPELTSCFSFEIDYDNYEYVEIATFIDLNISN